MFIDTHCHLNLIAKKKFDVTLTEEEILSLQDVISQANQEGVKSILTIGTSVIESQNCIRIAKKFEEVCAVAGIHPCDINQNWNFDFNKIKSFIKNKESNKIVGIGETGLDFHHKPYDKNLQIEVFEQHIELSIINDLPLVVHVRDSAPMVFEILNKYRTQIKGVIHCFSQGSEYAKKFLDLGFYLGLNAPVTYPKNQDFRQVIKYLPLDRILLETDAPFLPPQEHRGKINLPKYIPIFAKVIAELKNIDTTKLEKITTNNAKKLFDLCL